MTLLLLIAVGFGVRALAGRGRPRVRRLIIIATSVLAVGASYLALVYAPSAGETTIGTLLRWSPDLGLMTIAIVALSVVWVLALLVAARRAAARRGASSPT